MPRGLTDRIFVTDWRSDSDEPLTDAQAAYLNKFNETRRCRRNAAMTAERPDPIREAAGLPTTNPNLVFGGDVHVVWEKFCRYFDVEPRIVPLKPDAQTSLTALA